MTAIFTDPAFSVELLGAFRRVGTRHTAIRMIELPDGRSAEVLLESVTPPVSLTISDAADDAIPVVQLAKSIGWHVSVIDSRPAYAMTERFPMADAVHCLRPESLIASTPVVLPPTKPTQPGMA